MKQGIYEQLINKKIENKIAHLENLNQDSQKKSLDAAEAHLILSKYIEEVVRKALIFIREDIRKERKDKKNMVYQIGIPLTTTKYLKHQNYFYLFIQH